MRHLPLALILPLAGLLTAAARKDPVPTKYPVTPGTFKSTNPKPPALKLPKVDDSPGFSLPPDMADATWKVTDTVAGKKVANGVIRIFAFDDVGRGSKVGEIEIGTEMSIKAMRSVNGTVFYAFDRDGKTAWINGFFLERASGGKGSAGSTPPAK